MDGKIIKEVSIIITDGTNQDIVSDIRSLVWEHSDLTVDQIMVYRLSANHPTALVIRSKMNDDSYAYVKKRIEEMYPGLCTFNPPMRV